MQISRPLRLLDVRSMDGRIPSILIAAAEYHPLAKTGGLADMVRAIARSGVRHGFDVRVMIPAYPQVRAAVARNASTLVYDITRQMKRPARLARMRSEGLEIIAFDAPDLFARTGGLYCDHLNRNYTDNPIRFGAFAKAVALVASGSTPLAEASLVHLHDWHTGLYPAFADSRRPIPVVMTVHNFMFQGRFPLSVLEDLNLDLASHKLRSATQFGQISFLQVGTSNANRIVTVGESYASEVRLANRYNRHFLSDRDRHRLEVIANWSDQVTWSPGTDRALAAPYTSNTIERRRHNRAALCEEVGWVCGDAPIICTVSRITRAKGFRFLASHILTLLKQGFRVIVVGDGEPRLVRRLLGLAAQHPKQLVVRTPYRESMARVSLGGADFLLMPSLVEPSGLSQLQAQDYGCVPIVSRTGGLRDTVRDGHTGFLFNVSDPSDFDQTLVRALDAFQSPTRWKALQRACMECSLSGATDRGHYSSLYHAVLAEVVT